MRASAFVRKVTLLLLVVAGCGGSTPPADAPSSAANESTEQRNPDDLPLVGAKKELQGTWEIVKYQSNGPIDKGAMPLLGELFEVLRLRFEGHMAIAKAGSAPEESARFDIVEEHGREFRLVSKGGMFDGARCRFLDDGNWEVVDNGAPWPGLTVLKRVP